MLSNLKINRFSLDSLIIYVNVIASVFCILLLIFHFLDTFVTPQTYIDFFPDWDANRLSMAFFLKYKFRLYYPENEGAIIGNIYGPVFPLTYLPATIANSPTFALVLGKLISLGLYFLPVIWLYIIESKKNKTKISLTILALVSFFFFTIQLKTLSYNAFRIHADTPALAFSTLACIMIYKKDEKEISFTKLLISSILAVLALWTKQIAVPILIALPVYIFLTYDIKTFKRYLICLISSGIIISLLLIIAFNPQALWFNMVTVPGNHPWTKSNKILAIILATEELTQFCLLPGIIVGFWVLFTIPNKLNKIKIWLQENPWLLFFIISLFFIPTSILSRVKIGGDVNGMYSIYFLTITANLVLLKQASNLLIKPEEKILQRVSKVWLLVLVIMFLTVNFKLPIAAIYKKIPNFFNNVHQVVYEYCLKNPGKVYFPWHPLSTMMAEKKLYHFNDGVSSLALAGFPISKSHYMTYIPTNFTMIALPRWIDSTYFEYHRKYLTDFTQKIEVPELSGFLVYTKESNNLSK